MTSPSTEPRYDLDAWAVATDLGRRVFNYNYRMIGREIRNWTLVNTATMHHEAGVIERVYIWEKNGSEGKQLIRVGITETDQWRRAHAQLQAQLVYSMRPDVPRGSGTLAKIGDVSYAAKSRDTGPVAALLFTRGNMTVSVTSAGEEDVDVAAIARRIDQDFAEPPKKAEVAAKRAIDRSPRPLKVKKLEHTRLIEHLPEPELRNGWLKVIVPDGELAREGDELIYESLTSGTKRIAEFVVIQQ